MTLNTHTNIFEYTHTNNPPAILNLKKSRHPRQKKKFGLNEQRQRRVARPLPGARTGGVEESWAGMRLVDAFVRRPAAAVGWLLSSLGLTSTRGGAPRAKNNKKVKCTDDDEVTRAEVGASKRSRPENIGSPELNDRVNSSGEESGAIVDRTAGVSGEASPSGQTELNIQPAVPWGDLPEACVERILLGAGFQATLCATSACKSWRRVTSNQNFWRKVRAHPAKPSARRPAQIQQRPFDEKWKNMRLTPHPLTRAHHSPIQMFVVYFGRKETDAEEARMRARRRRYESGEVTIDVPLTHPVGFFLLFTYGQLG